MNSLNIENLYTKSQEVFKNYLIADLFIEQSQKKIIGLENGKPYNNSNIISSGYALRGFNENEDYFFFNNQLTEENIFNDLNTLSLKNQFSSNLQINNSITDSSILNTLYPLNTEINETEMNDLLQEINSYFYSKCSLKIINTQVLMSISKQDVVIINNCNTLLNDHRPFISAIVKCIVEKGNNRNNFYTVITSRHSLTDIKNKYQKSIDKLIIKMEKMIDATESVSGFYTTIFNAGNPGILIHEAVGHSLEGDFNRQKTSVFSDKMDKQIASSGVNIIDDGTIYGLNGSIHFDDEGTKSNKTLLVENGILKNYLFDRKNAFLMGVESTGNARRQNYSTHPIPRMTNTYLEAYSKEDECSLEEMKEIVSNEQCLYVKGISHGAVDITSGQFSFTCDEAYLLKKGEEIPLKNCVFSGMGSEILMNIKKIGGINKLTPGTCGKNGSWVPVTSGQQTLLLENINVG